MPFDALHALLPPLLIGLALSFVLEQLHRPRPWLPWQRSPADLMLHSASWLVLYLLEFAQFGRPWLALCLASTIFYVLILINHAKFYALREPFIYQDFDYFVDALKHPRLYLPFFGFFKICICLASVGLALWAGLSLETPLSQSIPVGHVIVAGLIILSFAVVLLYTGSRHSVTLSLQPYDDFTRRGLVALCWHYARAERLAPVFADLAKHSTLGSDSLTCDAQKLCGNMFVQSEDVYDTVARPDEKRIDTPARPNGKPIDSVSGQNGKWIDTRAGQHGKRTDTVSGQCEKRYDTVVVQSESFFDPRRTFSLIKPGVLSNFDQACLASALYGKLSVPAWGANTVRTEFAFLTGLDPAKVGIDQFNPYRRLVSSELPSLAREFKKRGYRTICIHPYPASFYQRDKVFSVLGFDEFIDLKSFAQTTQQQDLGLGPYVSDQILTDKILETLARPHEQPVFIFAITMENHGPLHLERITEADTRKWLSQPLPPNCQDLAIYLRHLANADQMILRLLQRFSATGASSQATSQAPNHGITQQLTSQAPNHGITQQLAPQAPEQPITPSPSARPIQLLWYGDHVPVLTKVYEQLGLPEGFTDYFLWRSDQNWRSEMSSDSEHVKTLGMPGAQRQLSPEPKHAHQLAAELLN